MAQLEEEVEKYRNLCLDSCYVLIKISIFSPFCSRNPVSSGIYCKPCLHTSNAKMMKRMHRGNQWKRYLGSFYAIRVRPIRLFTCYLNFVFTHCCKLLLLTSKF